MGLALAVWAARGMNKRLTASEIDEDGGAVGRVVTDQALQYASATERQLDKTMPAPCNHMQSGFASHLPELLSVFSSCFEWLGAKPEGKYMTRTRDAILHLRTQEEQVLEKTLISEITRCTLQKIAPGCSKQVYELVPKLAIKSFHLLVIKEVNDKNNHRGKDSDPKISNFIAQVKELLVQGNANHLLDNDQNKNKKHGKTLLTDDHLSQVALNLTQLFEEGYLNYVYCNFEPQDAEPQDAEPQKASVSGSPGRANEPPIFCQTV